jgi:uridine phosphorylase
MVTIARTGHRVGVVGAFGFGAVAAVSVLEELIALGAKRFITVGTAGALQSNCQIGDILVCDRAIRDDGVSQHYLPPEECASASPRMTELLSIALSARDLKYQIGTTWTTGALYRETKAEIAHYQQQGVVGVEMEAAALFAVARFRSVSLATLAVIADAVIAHPWHPAWASPQVSRALVNGYQACVEALCSPDF